MNLRFNFVLAALFFSITSFAQTNGFSPIRVDTQNFKVWSRVPHPTQTLSGCHLETNLNEAGDAILIQVGVKGSSYDYFGWDMPIPLADFPLKPGYHLEYRVPGMAHMNLDYDGTTLRLTWVKHSPVFTMIFPFSLEIDSTLSMPKAFEGLVAGYQKDIFGQPLKQLTESCQF